jgi:lipoprotein-anchoring transpeptidase ErfK/SrfK
LLGFGGVSEYGITARWDKNFLTLLYLTLSRNPLMRIYGGVGMHQGYLPGYPASHGCIRLPGHMAEKFFREVRVGTPVRVVPGGDASPE